MLRGTHKSGWNLETNASNDNPCTMSHDDHVNIDLLLDLLSRMNFIKVLKGINEMSENYNTYKRLDLKKQVIWEHFKHCVILYALSINGSGH